MLASCCAYVRETNWLNTKLLYYRRIYGTQGSARVDQREARDGSRHNLAILLKLSCESCWNLNLDGNYRTSNLEGASRWLWDRRRILLGLVGEIIERRQ